MTNTLKMTDYGFCHYAIVPVRAAASDESEIVTQLFFGDPVEVLEHGKPWIRVKLIEEAYEGWMDFKQLTYVAKDAIDDYQKTTRRFLAAREHTVDGPWGKQHLHLGANLSLLKGTELHLGQHLFSFEHPPKLNDEIISLANAFRNTPYLWGGKSIHGVDCSGYIQTIFKIQNVLLPRDASKQVFEGELIAYTDRKTGDIPFFINAKGIVHHVGILTDPNTILHAAGCVRADQFDEKGIYREDFGEYTHTYHSIRRF